MRVLLLLIPALAWSQFDRIEYRFIGPANMGGRTTDVEGVPGNPNIVYVGTGGGGVWKTVNAGVTWTPIFEREGTYSAGDMAIDPKNPDVIWLGTGESNTRNSVSFGDGIYKSTDGGKTWRHLGLKDTERISRVLLHPTDGNTVWVGALGHCFGPHPERGVFMTTDGGKTWTKTLYIDDKHGVADMDIDPSNPNILYAAMWEFERKPWMHRSGSEKGGVFRSVDGGRTWTRLTNGLPKLLGRIGVKVAPSKPNTVYVVAESKEGTFFRSDDRGDHFTTVSRDRTIPGRGFYYADIRVDPVDENRVYALGSTLQKSADGGRTWLTISQNIHPDYHALWIDPTNPHRMWQGQDGGIAVSYDRGDNWEAVLSIPLGQFYQIHADNRHPFYHVVGGLQDNGTWTGPSRTRDPGGIFNDDWQMVSYGDGFFAIAHPDNPDLFLTESQGGALMLTDMRTRESNSARPAIDVRGPANFPKHRFNWNAPIEPSRHEKNTVYVGGNIVFKSTDFGRSWRPISPDLSKNEKDKQKDAGGPVFYENTTAEYHGTVISLAESPVRPGTIWAGTDDGNLQRTTDGERWTNLTANLPVPSHSPVSHVEPSRSNADTAYVAFDRHMFDDFKPLIYKTSDGGKTFVNLTEGLPANAYVHVVKEDPRNPSLLYAGTEIGLFVSWNGGQKWQRLHLKNLPHVAVHDIVVHPRENDLILATHGRSVVILDDATFLQKWDASIAASDVHLFEPRVAQRLAMKATRMSLGAKAFRGTNPAYGALLTYYLKAKPKSLKVEILQDGKVIRTLRNPPSEEGLNRTGWDLRMEGPLPRRQSDGDEEEGGRGARGGVQLGPGVLPGTYAVRVTADGKTEERPVEVRMDPTAKVADADLKKTFEAGARMVKVQTQMTNTLRMLDSLQEQVAAVEKTMKNRAPDSARELAPVFTGAKEAIRNALERVAPEPDQTRPAPPPSLQARTFCPLPGNAAPSEAVMQCVAGAETESARVLKEIDETVNAQLGKWNEALRKAGAPVLVR